MGKRSATASRSTSTSPKRRRTKGDFVNSPAITSPSVLGHVLAWGTNDCGQIGVNGEDEPERKYPKPVNIDGELAIQVVCGGMHTIAVTKRGEVFSWGVSDDGALGRPLTAKTPEHMPLRVGGDIEGVKIIMASCGDSHTLALAESGDVYGWGSFRDSGGVVGFNPEERYSRSPVLILPVGNGPKVVKVISGSDHALALRSDGVVLSIGNGEQGALGRVGERQSRRDHRKNTMLRFYEVRIKRNIVDIFAGSFNSFFLVDGGDVFGCGLNNEGQLALGDVEQSEDSVQAIFTPVLIKSLSNKNIIKVVSGQHHGIALSADGKVYSFGCANYGRLGLGESVKEKQTTVQCIESLSDQGVVDIAAGSSVSYAILRNGTALSWGMASSLQLGTTGDEDLDGWEPTPIRARCLKEGPKGKPAILAISGGGQHAALIVDTITSSNA